MSYTVECQRKQSFRTWMDLTTCESEKKFSRSPKRLRWQKVIEIDSPFVLRWIFATHMRNCKSSSSSILPFRHVSAYVMWASAGPLQTSTAPKKVANKNKAKIYYGDEKNYFITFFFNFRQEESESFSCTLLHRLAMSNRKNGKTFRCDVKRRAFFALSSVRRSSFRATLLTPYVVEIQLWTCFASSAPTHVRSKIKVHIILGENSISDCNFLALLESCVWQRRWVDYQRHRRRC